MSRTKALIVAALVGIAVGPPLSGAEDGLDMSHIFPMDPAHSYVGFSVKYMGFAKVRGRFTDYSGTVRYDRDDIERTSATVVIKTASIDTGHDERDEDLRSEDWLDARKYPTIVFRSKRAVKTKDGFDLVGDLTIKGVTKEVKLRMVKTSGPRQDVWGDTQVICTGGLKMDRTKFDVEGTGWSRVRERVTAVDDEVEVELSILAKQVNKRSCKDRVKDEESAAGRIYKVVKDEGVASAIIEFNRMRSSAESRLDEEVLIIVGYALLKDGDIDDAVAILRENTGAFPGSPKALDCLGEAHATSGDRESAVKSYERSLELDPANANAMEILRHLGDPTGS